MEAEEPGLSSPFATGGGGFHFETQVQASFAILMLARVEPPCLPGQTINKVKLQGRYQGFETDDLILFTSKRGKGAGRKLLGQIKHNVKITKSGKNFGEVVRAAWKDFNNPNVFSKNGDVFALISGPLSATDTYDARIIPEWARDAENASDLFRRVEQTNFSSARKIRKLDAFRTQLRRANNDVPISDEELFEFLKRFHILGYDFDKKSGVSDSLLRAVIGRHDRDRQQWVWEKVVSEVQFANENAGTLTIESFPSEIRDLFRKKEENLIPSQFSQTIEPVEVDTSSTNLALASLIGSWNENNEGDIEQLKTLIGEDFSSWLHQIHESLHDENSAVTLRNGVWRVKDRKSLWEAFGSRIYDTDLESFKEVAFQVLSELNPIFELPEEERIMAGIRGKVLRTSEELRQGLSETLALTGSRPQFLTNASQGKPRNIAALIVRDILKGSEWKTWASLNYLLPLFSEAAPDQFLREIEGKLQEKSSVFSELFEQESSGFLGANYHSGLLWALENLAWDPDYLVRTTIALGELAAIDPGGNWGNRPLNSLVTIFLPWYPQTVALFEKRKVAINTLVKENPEIAWKLVVDLLPNQHQTSKKSHKPKYRETIPEDWKEGVTVKEYWEQVAFFAGIAVDMAKNDVAKLTELVEQFGNLTPESLDKAVEILTLPELARQNEEAQFELWSKLQTLISRHKRFKGAKWAIPPQRLEKIEDAASQLAPTDPALVYRRIFTGNTLDFYDDEIGFEESRKILKEQQVNAIRKILSLGGVDMVEKFALTVERPRDVGWSLAALGNHEIDAEILPSRLGPKSRKLSDFVRGYVWGRQSELGWEWFDQFEKTGWSTSEVADFLVSLPFSPQAWVRSAHLLKDSEGEYWKKTNANPYDTDEGLGPAVEKLLAVERPVDAIRCLTKMAYNELPIDSSQAVRALISALSISEAASALDVHDTVRLIKVLQDDPATNEEDLSKIEWAYLPLLNEHSRSFPRTLQTRLSKDPEFFCEVIRVIYKPRNQPRKEEPASEDIQAMATNAFRLLYDWKIPPGLGKEGEFSSKEFNLWLKGVQKKAKETDHLEVSMVHLGHVLNYCPKDPDGFWIDKSVASVLNRKESTEIREGLTTEIINSRGVHFVDPTGKPELELAAKYNKRAEETEDAGYQRLAASLRQVARMYEREAHRNIDEHSGEVSPD